MSKSKIVAFKKPGDISEDPLTELLRCGARKLITDAVEVELQELLNQYSDLKMSMAISRLSAMDIYRSERSRQVLVL